MSSSKQFYFSLTYNIGKRNIIIHKFIIYLAFNFDAMSQYFSILKDRMH